MAKGVDCCDERCSYRRGSVSHSNVVLRSSAWGLVVIWQEPSPPLSDKDPASHRAAFVARVTVFFDQTERELGAVGVCKSHGDIGRDTDFMGRETGGSMIGDKARTAALGSSSAKSSTPCYGARHLLPPERNESHHRKTRCLDVSQTPLLPMTAVEMRTRPHERTGQTRTEHRKSESGCVQRARPVVECRSLAYERRAAGKMVPETRARVHARNRPTLSKASQHMKPTLHSTAGCGTARPVVREDDGGNPASYPMQKG